MPDGVEETEPEPTWVTDSAQNLMKVTVTDVSADSDTVHVVPVPEQPPPLHDRTRQPEAAVAVSTTDEPVSRTFEDVSEPVLVDRPDASVPTDPEPTWVRDKVNCCTYVTVTDCADVIDTVHVVLVPEQPPPLHDRTRQPEEGVAVSATDEPVSYVVLAVRPALLVEMLESADAIAPEPTCVSDSTHTFTNVAVTFFAADIVTVQVPDGFVHAPPQPENRHPDAAVAVSVTEVPVSKSYVAEPAAASEIPDGLDDTPPEPTWRTLNPHT